MNKLFLSLAAAAVLFASCDNTPDATEVKGTEAQQVDSSKTADAAYKVDPAASVIEWMGSKPTGDGHNGTINLKEGTLTVDANKALNGGSFIIDIASIKVLDIKDSAKNAGLVGHLLGTGDPANKDDFFNVTDHPTGKFEITAVKAADSADKVDYKEATHVISGNLTLKGVTKNISFPAKVNVTDNTIEAASEMNIDRTEWNIKFMSDETIKDKFINKKINLKLNIKAAK